MSNVTNRWLSLRVQCVAKFYCVSIADCSVKLVNLSFNGVLYIYSSLICILCILLSVNSSEVWHDFVDTLYIFQKLALLCTFLEKQLNEMETKDIVTCAGVSLYSSLLASPDVQKLVCAYNLPLLCRNVFI